MDIQDLKPADIVLFSGIKKGQEYYYVSRVIMFLTDSPVYHAALSYWGNDEIIEETPPAVQIGMAQERFKGHEIYVMRTKKQYDSMDPVLKAAKEHLNDEEPYSIFGLFMIGLILLYRKFTPDSSTRRIMIKILERLAADIMDFINRHKGKLPMVCSQFVYQCYYDAGTDYQLKIRDVLLAKSSLAGPRANLSVLDQATDLIKTRQLHLTQDSLSESLAVRAMPEQSEEELAQELMEALQSTQPGIPDGSMSDEFLLAVSNFSRAVYHAHTGESPETLTALTFVQNQEAYFVTPGDLYKNCENIEEIGVIKVT